MKWVGLTDKGKVRENNEDTYYVPKNEETFFLLADGMGGHLGGERASDLAVQSLSAELKKITKEDSVKERILESIEKTNSCIFKEADADPEYSGMGTTLSLLYLQNNTAYYANIGDSRIYALEDKTLEQITKDDSFVNYLLDIGEISVIEAEKHPRRNVLTKALGSTIKINVEVNKRTVSDNTIFLLCSDGLTTLVHKEEIEKILLEHSIENAGRTLLNLALDRGGNDNITLILVSMK